MPYEVTPHLDSGTGEHANPVDLTADVELGTMRNEILGALDTKVSVEDSKAVYTALVKAFAVGEKGKRESPLRALNHGLVEAIIFDEALNGKAWNPKLYDVASTNSLTITNTMAVTGFVASFFTSEMDDSLATRELLSAPGADKNGEMNPKKLVQKLVGEYLDTDEWQSESLAQTAVTAAFLVSTIYARAARTGNKKFITAVEHEVISMYEKFYEAHPAQDVLRIRTRQEIGKLLSGGPNELIDFMELLEADGPLVARTNLIGSALAAIYSALKDLSGDIKGSQERMQIAAAALRSSSSMPEFIDYLYDPEGQEVVDEAITDDAQIRPGLELKPMELNWEVLPPGELENHARDIVLGIGNGHAPEIDLLRLKALAEIRNVWGEDNCYYARGRRGRRHVIRDGVDLQPDEYIMLILQERGSDGTLRYEHALAESPIVGPHAMYIFRQDVNEGTNWREVMSVPKHIARSKGARAVKHISSVGLRNLSMVEKAELLLTCTAEEFRRIQFKGIRGFRLPKDAVEVDDAASSSES